VSHVKNPNGELCHHPKSAVWNDLERGETVCQNCGEVLQRTLSPFSADLGHEKYGRGPGNSVVFNKNLGGTSKANHDQAGSEPCHYHALAAVYGNRSGSKRPLELITQTCPSCGSQYSLRVFGDVVTCEQCDSQLAEYILQLIPANVKRYGRTYDMQFKVDHSSEEEIRETALAIRLKLQKLHAEIGKVDLTGSSLRLQLLVSAEGNLKRSLRVLESRFGKAVAVRRVPNQAVNWNRDLRTLQHLNPVEDDPLLKAARELLSERLDGKLSPENADMIGTMYMKSVKQLVQNEHRHLKSMLEQVLDSVIEIQSVNA
jgi:transcription elongation factor Elf1